MENLAHTRRRWIFLILALAWGAISTAQMLRSGLSQAGGNDLYTYWYAGLHIRQGADPYQAFLKGDAPDVPIQFVDGEAIDLVEIVRPELQPAPGLTLPLILLATPLAFFRFQSAKIIWFFLLMTLNFVIPWLLVRAVWRDEYPPPYTYLILLAIFMGFSSTRYASISGQPSIPVIALMLLSWIWAKERPYLAGLLLGIALSKYSLALGFWIYFTFVERRPRLSTMALAIQITGLIGLAWLGNSTLLAAIDGYIQLFLHHAPMEGIQLTSLLPGIDAYSPTLAAGLTLVVAIPLIFSLRRLGLDAEKLHANLLLRVTMLTLLTFWSLLVAYHRAYDLQVFIIAIASILFISHTRQPHWMDRRIVTISIIYAAVSLLFLSLPAGSLVRTWLPQAIGSLWIRLILRSSTWVILIGLGLGLAFFLRIPSHIIRNQSP